SCNVRSHAGGSRPSTSIRRASTAPPAAARRPCSACRRQAFPSPSSVPVTTWPPCSKVSSPRRPCVLRTVVLAGPAALVIAAEWLRFEEPRSGGGRPFVLAVLAIAPALLRPWWLRLSGAAVSAFFALCLALSVSPLDVGDAGARFGRGFLDFYEFRLPIDPHD